MNPRMLARIRTGVVLLVLLGLVLAAVVWGWTSLTKPLPGSAAGTCTDVTLEQGDKLYPDQVIVTVLNAGTRNGLASRTMSNLVEQGFVSGEDGNAPGDTDVARVQIWTDQPGSPQVRLVRSYLGKKRSQVVRRDPIGEGVNIVVGDRFNDLRNGRKQVPVREELTLCVPPESQVEG